MMTKNTQINCDSINSTSELVINQSFVSGEEKKDDTTTENTKINTNEHESFISDILKDIGMSTAFLYLLYNVVYLGFMLY